jgi:hypothetical protein
MPNEEMMRAFCAAIGHGHTYMPITGDDNVTVWVCRFCGDETRLAEEAAARSEEPDPAFEAARLRAELRRIISLVRTAHDGASVATRTRTMDQLGEILNDYREALDAMA